MSVTKKLARQYSQAIVRVLEKTNNDNSIVVKKLIENLRSTGRLKLISGIVRELKVIEALEKKKAPFIEIAREEDREFVVTTAKKRNLPKVIATVNPSLIRGWRSCVSGTLVDNSTKQSLIKLYRNITN